MAAGRGHRPAGDRPGWSAALERHPRLAAATSPGPQQDLRRLPGPPRQAAGRPVSLPRRPWSRHWASRVVSTCARSRSWRASRRQFASKAARQRRPQAGRIEFSLTHSRDYAAAVALIPLSFSRDFPNQRFGAWLWRVPPTGKQIGVALWPRRALNGERALLFGENLRALPLSRWASRRALGRPAARS